MKLQYLFLAVQILGIVSAFRALFTARDERSSIAWFISLITFPWLGLPLYWLFARRSFESRVLELKNKEKEFLQYQDYPFPCESDGESLIKNHGYYEELFTETSRLAKSPILNLLNLQIQDNKQAIADIFLEIEKAEKRIWMQFFIWENNSLSDELLKVLAEKAKRGIDVRILYDFIGTKFESKWIKLCRQSGIKVGAFSPYSKFFRSLKKIYQLNFRNHRKLVFIDDNYYLGGMNWGNTYLSQSKISKFKPWYDTMIKFQTNNNAYFEKSWAMDWYEATKEKIVIEPASDNLNFSNILIQNDCYCFPIASGPTKGDNYLSSIFVNLIEDAKESIQIVTPYFVPNSCLLNALIRAINKGVRVEIVFPGQADHYSAWYASMNYLKKITQIGGEVNFLVTGFVHSKILLIDKKISLVGSANFDQRSMDLNYEFCLAIYDQSITNSFSQAFADLKSKSHIISIDYFLHFNIYQKTLMRFFYLFSSVL